MDEKADVSTAGISKTLQLRPEQSRLVNTTACVTVMKAEFMESVCTYNLSRLVPSVQRSAMQCNTSSNLYSISVSSLNPLK